MRTRSVALETQLSLGEAANVVHAAFSRMKAHVEAIEAPPDPLDPPDGVADIALVGHRSTMLSIWAVQVYFFDLGDSCGVELVALGEGGFSRVMRGTRNTAALTKGLEKIEFLVADLRSRDPGVQVFG